MSYSDLFRIAPQMKHYNNLIQVWHPYVMYLAQAHFSSPCVSTDQFGFRPTVYRGHEYSPAKNREISQIVVGGSTAFGVGSTSNAYTVSSYLSQLHEKPWLCLSGRAHNAFQEYLTYLLFGPPGPAQVVLYSGLNNLTTSYLCDEASPILSPIYQESLFRDLMNQPYQTPLYRMKSYLKSVFQGQAPKMSVTPASMAERYARAISNLERSLALWSELGKVRGLKITYVLQPSLLFFEKELAPQEAQAFALLDRLQQPVFQLFKSSSEVTTLTQSYSKDVEALVGKYSIKFLDLNRQAEFRCSDWLFVDRAHLTDRGYQLSAQIISKSFLD